VHLAADLPREWFEQLTAEQRVLIRVNGKDSLRWVKRRQRNEALDCRNYAAHGAFGLGLHNFTDKRWQQLEAAVQPADDLFTRSAAPTPAPIEVKPTATTTPPPPRRAPPRAAQPRYW
jgi:phage terminase large subunit GpA-like protein